MLKLGVIGYGSRIAPLIDLFEKTGKCRMAAITDVRNEELKKAFEQNEDKREDLVFYSDADEMLTKEKLDGVLIGTRCSLHTKFAKVVAKYNVPLFLEKPVCTTDEDLAVLRQLAKDYPYLNEKCVVSFPLRLTLLLQNVKEIIDSGKIGTVEHVQAYNNVPYGRNYFHKWYRDENETGGLFLQKATHDLDYINYILGIKPIRLCAMKSKRVFKGDHPAGLMCKNCAERETCPESDINVKSYGALPKECDYYCCFAVDTGNEDSGSVIIEYETGMHVVYSQDFIARKKAAKRGARFFGYLGTLEFDWRQNRITVYMHNTDRVENYDFDVPAQGHNGGDDLLVKNFIDVMNGKDISHSTFEEGILSAHMCLEAKHSAETYTFRELI